LDGSLYLTASVNNVVYDVVGLDWPDCIAESVALMRFPAPTGSTAVVLVFVVRGIIGSGEYGIVLVGWSGCSVDLPVFVGFVIPTDWLIGTPCSGVTLSDELKLALRFLNPPPRPKLFKFPLPEAL
jgi:hypothetical protein